MLLACHLSSAVSPVVSFSLLTCEGYHFECLVTLQARTYVNTVAATEAVHNVNLLYEVHTLHGSRCLHLNCLTLEASEFVVCEYERTDSSVRTYEVTLVTLDTVLLVPYRNESSYATLLVSGSALVPSTVFCYLEGTNGKEVTILCVDRTYHVRDESGFITYNLLVLGECSPCRINSELLVFTTTVNGLVVLINDILTLFAV